MGREKREEEEEEEEDEVKNIRLVVREERNFQAR